MNRDELRAQLETARREMEGREWEVGFCVAIFLELAIVVFYWTLK